MCDTRVLVRVCVHAFVFLCFSVKSYFEQSAVLPASAMYSTLTRARVLQTSAYLLPTLSHDHTDVIIPCDQLMLVRSVSRRA